MSDHAADPPDDPVPVSPEARRMARELAVQVDRVTHDLPFGAEPADYLVIRDRLAEPPPDRRR